MASPLPALLCRSRLRRPPNSPTKGPNPTDEQLDWGNLDNWTPATVGGEGDDVVVQPDPTSRGPIVSDERKVKSLELNSGINIRRGGSLTVTDGITINANSGYFINDGVVTGAVVNNAYISSTNEFHGDVTNNAGSAIINESVDGGPIATWTGAVGFAASGSKSSSDDFADVGSMDLTIGPELDVYFGATFTGSLALSGGATSFAPFASVSLHDDLLSPITALFTDSAGGTADIPVETLGTYVALGVGFDAFQIPVLSGKQLDAGLHADFKLGDNVTESSVSGYARMSF